MDPNFGTVQKSTHGRRPSTRTKRRSGLWYDPTFRDLPFDPANIPDMEYRSKLGRKTTNRGLFRKALAIWHQMTLTQKRCWYLEAKAHAAKCSYFDFFMRQQLKYWRTHNTWDYETCSTCPPAEILYTTAQMPAGSSQILTLQNAIFGPYTWTIPQGGGAFEYLDEFTVRYTAPLTNPNCANNPLITVTDFCGHDTVLKLAINTDTNPFINAYYIPFSAVRAQCAWVVNKQNFNCIGEPLTVRQCYGCTCFNGPPDSCECWSGANCTEAGVIAMCNQAAGSCSALYSTSCNPNTAYDIRTPSQKSAGCCPAAIL